MYRKRLRRGARSLVLVVVVFLSAGVLVPSTVEASQADVVGLQGDGLTLDQVVAVARHQAPISVSPDVLQRVDRGFKVVLEAALQNIPVYGLTVGVGLNKDRPIFTEVNGQRVLSDEVLDVSRKFNLSSLRAHGAGVGEPMAAEVVRAGMLIRLNNMLSGACGAQRGVAEHYIDFLNKGIVPVVPSTGTVGEADITLASHIGLVMVGEWEAFYQGRRMSGAEALKAAGIEPLRPVGKDFLCIISNNGLVVGDAALGVYDAERYLQREAIVFALSLEGLNGNVAPFLPATTEARPFPGMVEAAGLIRNALTGSSLWRADKSRALQDPLSYRDMAYVLGDAMDAIKDAEDRIMVHINHPEDNPMVDLDTADLKHQDSTQVARYLIGGGAQGAIYPTANFEPLPVVSAVERLSLALGTLSDSVTMSILRLAEPEVTHLNRFLAAPDNKGHAFGAIQKAFVAVNSENRTLAMPVSLDSVAVAGNIEDRATHSQLATAHLRRLTANLYELASFQLLHAAQAVDLRAGFALGEQTHELYDAYRDRVPFVTQDRVFTPDIRQGAVFLQNWPVDAVAGSDQDNGRQPVGGVPTGAGGTMSGVNVFLLVLGGLAAGAGGALLVRRRPRRQRAGQATP